MPGLSITPSSSSSTSTSRQRRRFFVVVPFLCLLLHYLHGGNTAQESNSNSNSNNIIVGSGSSRSNRYNNVASAHSYASIDNNDGSHHSKSKLSYMLSQYHRHYNNLPTSVPNTNNNGIPNVLVTTKTIPTFHMFVYPPETDQWISKRILQTGVYEGGTTELFVDHLPLLLVSNVSSSDAINEEQDSNRVDTDVADDESKTTVACDVNLVLDLGSNLGYYSLLAASRGYNVVSFEASPDTAWLQRSSAALNGFSTGTTTQSISLQGSSQSAEIISTAGTLLLIDKGVSDTFSSGRMSRYDNSPGMTSFVGANSTNFDLKPGVNGSALDVTIDLVRAHDVLLKLGLDYSNDIDDEQSESNRNNNNNDIINGKVCYKLLKIDVEGYELRALHGLWGSNKNIDNNSKTTTTTSLSRYPFETIIMEYFPSLLKSAGVNDPMNVIRYIASWGYEFYIIESNSKKSSKNNNNANEGSRGLSKIENIEEDDRIKDIHGSGYHINLLAKKEEVEQRKSQ